MIRQTDRSAATVEAILAAARTLFAREGFGATSIDAIAAGAGVAKGAVYHHFASKEAIFTRVLDGVQAELAAAPPPPAVLRAADPFDAMAQGVEAYLTAAMAPGVKQILLIDGPVVTGWLKWRDIDDRHFSAGTRRILETALAGSDAAKDIDAIMRLLMGAVMEAALACANAPDPAAMARRMSRALRRMLGGLRG